jgi:hypothetical protein
MAEWAAGNRPTAEKFNRRGIKARGRRTTSTGTTTTTVLGVLRLDDIPILTGYCYRVKATGLFGVSSVTNDRIRCDLRYTTNAATPSISSPILPGGQCYQWVQIFGGSTGETAGPCETVYEPAADETLSVLLTVVRSAGTGNVSLFADADHCIQLFIEAIGIAVTDTGTDI